MNNLFHSSFFINRCLFFIFKDNIIMFVQSIIRWRWNSKKKISEEMVVYYCLVVASGKFFPKFRNGGPFFVEAPGNWHWIPLKLPPKSDPACRVHSSWLRGELLSCPFPTVWCIPRPQLGGRWGSDDSGRGALRRFGGEWGWGARLESLALSLTEIF